MAAVDSATIDVADEGQVRGQFEIYLLPDERTKDPRLATLVDARSDPDRVPELEDVQLLEGAEYGYVLRAPAGVDVSLEPSELFFPDVDGRRGRVRTGLNVGSVQVQVRVGPNRLGSFGLEIRSRKLEYLKHYRWMLDNIAEFFTELILERFSPAELRLSLDETLDAKSLYQQFAFLQNTLLGANLDGALQRILSRPYVSWEVEKESRHPGGGIKNSSQVSAQFARAGDRIPWRGGPVPSIPERIMVERTEPVIDNIPNRFIKFVLEQWRDFTLRVQAALQSERSNQPVDRGLRETQALLDRLESLLSEQLFRHVGALRMLPMGSQVLQKREGYREVLRAFVTFQLASTLSWTGGEDVYAAGQRDVATLYEYWVFLEIAQLVSSMCEETIDFSDLIKLSSSGLTLALTRSGTPPLKASVVRMGRRLNIELWFNKTFGVSSRGSWTTPLRPDVALLVRAPNDVVFEPIWVHFDAKYRIDTLTDVLGRQTSSIQDEESLAEETEIAEEKGTAKIADLLKMHAYRDAIRRTAGAYVIYPGTERKDFHRYHEILPGLGAFALRPTQVGEPQGADSLQSFLEDVLKHAANQLTQHERERFWVARITREPAQSSGRRVARFLSVPPADTRVLLGFVKSAQHLDWIHSQGRYNIRADDRTGAVGLNGSELGAELVVLYGSGIGSPELRTVRGSPEVVTQAQMIRFGYPTPRGELYFCFPLGDQVVHTDITDDMVKAALLTYGSTKPPGAPVAVSWSDLVTG